MNEKGRKKGVSAEVSVDVEGPNNWSECEQ